MSSSIPYSKVCSNFDQVYQEALSTKEPITITREGFENISVIATAELDRLIETVYLFQSHKNLVRLLDALQRAKARTNQPQTVEELRQEFGLDKEEATTRV